MISSFLPALQAVPVALLFIFRPKYSPRAWISYSSPSLSELQNPDSHPRDEVPTGSHGAPSHLS